MVLVAPKRRKTANKQGNTPLKLRYGTSAAMLQPFEKAENQNETSPTLTNYIAVSHLSQLEGRNQKERTYELVHATQINNTCWQYPNFTPAATPIRQAPCRRCLDFSKEGANH